MPKPNLTDWVTPEHRFKYKEFFVSSEHPREFKNIIVPDYVFKNIQNGVVEVLDPLAISLQKKFGKKIPIHVTSGYRTAKLNSLVGGSPSSQHLDACAADIVLGAIVLSSHELGIIIADERLAYEQLVVYNGKPHVHVSWARYGVFPKKKAVVLA